MQEMCSSFQSSVLERCFYLSSKNNCHLLRMALVDTPVKAEALRDLAVQFSVNHHPLRCMVAQYALFDSEMMAVRAERSALLQLDNERFNCEHLLIETEPLYAIEESSRLLGIALSDYHRLIRLEMVEAYATYLLWISEELEALIPTFAFSDTEEFESEKRFKDLNHEVRSPLFRQLQDRTKELVVQFQEISYEDSAERRTIEKALTAARVKMLDALVKIIPFVSSAAAAVFTILDRHPELQRIYDCLRIYHCLLQNEFGGNNQCSMAWTKRLLLLQCLDYHLGVLSVATSMRGVFRVNIAFAARAALLSLLDTDISDILDAIENDEWLLNEEALSEFDKELKKRTLDYLLLFSGMEHPTEVSPSRSSRGFFVNQDFVRLLPKTYVAQDGSTLAIWDCEREKKTCDLTDDGRSLLQNILFDRIA